MVNDLEGGEIPYYCVDVAVGPYRDIDDKQHRIRYLVDQMHGLPKWLTKRWS